MSGILNSKNILRNPKYSQEFRILLGNLKVSRYFQKFPISDFGKIKNIHISILYPFPSDIPDSIIVEYSWFTFTTEILERAKIYNRILIE